MSPSSVSVDHAGCCLVADVRGDGPPVLFVQGVGLHGDGWLPQTEALARDFRCISFDNRGMGRSQPPGGAITVERMGEDGFAILDRLGVESAHLVGHSLGGLVVQAMALKAPARARSLSLLCTVSRGRDATRLTGRMLWLGITSSIGSRRSRRAAFLRIVTAPGSVARGEEDRIARELEPLFGHDLAVSPPIAMKQFSALRAYDSTERLSDLAGMPTLVVSGAHDLVARPEYGRRLAAAIPGARYVEVAEGAHGMTIQLAGTINDLLSSHLHAAELRHRAALTGVGE